VKSLNEQAKESLAFWLRHWMEMAAAELARRAMQNALAAQDLRQRVAQMPPQKR
jgi:hypothetical protein